MNGQYRIINSQQSLDAAIQQLKEDWQQHKWLMIQVSTEKQRTQLQNSSLHLWCGWVGTALNDGGFDVREVLARSKRQEIPWAMPAVKEHLWRPVQEAYCAKKSTSKISTSECIVISDVLNKTFGQEFGIHIPWPEKRK